MYETTEYKQRSIADLFVEHFTDRYYPSEEEYKSDLNRFVESLRLDLETEARRWEKYQKQMCDHVGVEIESEDEED